MSILLAANEVSEQIVGQFGWAALFSLVGLVIVFMVLAVLVVILTLLSKIINSPAFEKKKNTDKHISANTVTHVSHATEHSSEVVAAITAALSIIYAAQTGTATVREENSEAVPPPPFVIKSIKKI